MYDVEEGSVEVHKDDSENERISIMKFQIQLLVFAVTTLSVQSEDNERSKYLIYSGLKLRVDNAAMVPPDKVKEIINLRDLLLKKARYAKDCNELLKQGFSDDGLYVIQPEPVQTAPLLVVNCVMKYDCGGWTVLQRNSKNSEMTWNETWTSYKYGFGNIQGDHYIGNQYMHFITNQMWYKGRVLMEEEMNGKKYLRHAEYDIFRIGSVDEDYKLYLGAFSGNGGDALSTPKNLVDNFSFSSRDRDRDGDAANCAEKFGGGWWFNSCSSPKPFAMLTQKEFIHWDPFCKNCTHVSLLVRSVNMHCSRKGMRSRI
ncbi:fibrinogen-like protein 1-like protein [Narcine bancroftii]|uniref:fibrinogen-like protein 1-like protein n=1 Tax=Narcine bancroftii TaxID=1343680 RepID=UPI0038319C41